MFGRSRSILAVLFLATAFLTSPAHAQCVSLTTLGSAYTQNFDTLSNVAGSTTNNLTIPGWFLTESGGGARDNEQYAVDTGSSTTGDTYSYGAAGSTERALGSLRSGTLIPVFGACFTNNTGSTITSLDVNYYGEQWRLGTAGRTDQLNFEYSLNATDLVTGTWTGVTALNFVTPDTVTTGAKNGNAAADRTAKSASIASLSIANGATFWIHWVDTDATGADDGLAVDDFSLTPQSAGPPPTVSSIVRAGGNPTNAASVDFTVTFSQSVTGVDSSDFSITKTGSVSGAAVSNVTGSGTTYTVTVNTGSGDGTLRLDVIDDDSIVNGTSVPLGGSGAGNGGFTSGETYTVDKTAPSISSIVRASSNPTNAASVDFTVTFGESVTGVSASSFALTSTVTGASIGGVTGSGTTYTVSINSGTGDGTIRLDGASDAAVLDAAGNANASSFIAGESYTIDKSGPDVVSIVRTNLSPTAAASVDFTVTFNESVTGVDASDFDLTASGLVGVSVTNVSGSGTTYTVTASTGSGASGTLRLDVISGATISDILGNAYAGSGFTTGETYTIDRNAPSVLSVVRVGSTPTNAASVSYTVTFSQSVTGVDSTDFSLATAGIAGASVSGVSGSGTTYTVSVSTGSGDGTIRLDVVNDGSIQSSSAVPLAAGFTSGEVYTIDKSAPAVSSIVRASASPTNAASVQYTLTFTESVIGVDATDFVITTAGPTGVSVTNVTGSGTTYTATVNSGTGDGTLRLDFVSNGSVFDTAGNATTSGFTGGDTFTIDKTAPAVSSIVKASADPSSAATVDFTVTFGEPVTGVDATDFAITAPALTGTSVAGVSGSGTTFTVTVNSGSGNGSLRLDFLSDGSVIDGAGNAAAAFSSGESFTMQGTPPAPAALGATPGNGHVALTWTASTGATTYNVKRGTASGGPYTTLSSTVATTSYDDLTATNGTPYFYVVSANGARGTSSDSNEAPATPAAPSASSFGVVISQVYGGGGNAGSTYKNDYIELFNKSNSSVSLTGWSVQYSSATSTSWQVTSLSGAILPGHYFLVQEGAGSGGTTSLPTPDSTGTINMAGTAGKVALVNVTTALSGSCPNGTQIADLAGYGTTASCFEGTGPTPAPSNSNAIFRADNGCTDTNNNAADFTAATAAPRNSANSASCSGFAVVGAATPSAVDAGATSLLTATVTPGQGPASSGITVTANLSAIGGSATQTLFDDGTNGDATPGDNVFSFNATVAGGTTAGFKSLAVTANDAQARTVSTTISLTVNPSIISPIAAAKIDTTPADTIPDLLGQLVRIRGVVTSIDFRGGTGIEYYIQDTTGGIDVFNATTDFGPYTLGTNVEVVGTIAQFNGLTEITPLSITTLAGGTLPAVTPQVVTLSQLTSGEAFEGQLVQVNNVTITSGTFPATGSSGNVTITDSTGTGTLRVDSDTDIDGSTTPGGVFTVVGLVSQSDTTAPYDSGYQILPRALTDIFVQTAPAGSGSATPSSVTPGATTLLTVAVTPGQNPTSTGITVTANLSGIGGSAAQAFYDDATHGDAVAGDGIFSFDATVAAGTALGAQSLPFTAGDLQLRASAGSIALFVQSATAPLAPTGVTATPGNAQVALSWNASAGATGYNVKRATVSGGPYVTIASPAATSYTDTTVSNGTRYYYVVSATNPDESGPSSEVNALPTAPPPSGSLAKIYFVDIGQGAATLIVSPAGKSLLVDGGPTGQGNAKIVPLLNSLGITTIDYTVLTHYHIDHDDGLLEVINAGRVAGTAYDNGDTATLIPPNFSTSPSSTYGTYARYVSALASHTGTVTRVRPEDTPSGTLAGTVIDLGGGMKATLLEQGGRLLSGASVPISNQDLNTESISVLVEYNNFDFLVSGDMTGGGSTDTAKTADVETYVGQMAGDIDVLEFDHHGSTTANNRRFLKMIKAEAGLAEAGYTNTFGHPNRETFNKYLNIAATSGNTYPGTTLPVPGNGPVAYQTDPSPAGDQRCTLQGYSGAAPVNAGNGTILLQTDGTTSFTMESFDDGGARLSASSHVYALDATGAGVTTNFPPTVIPSINPAVPLSTDAVTISAQVDDREDPIASVTLNYSVGGVAQTPVTMTPAGGDLYTATIAAQPDGNRVDYTITALAGGASTSYSGGYFTGTTPISSLRVMDSLGSPVYWDYAARVQGTVTSGTGNFASGTNDDYLQDATGAINIWRTIQPSTPAVQTTTAGGVYSVAGLIGENGGRLRLEVTPRFTDTSTTPYGCTLISSGSVPAPLVRTIAQINAAPESLEAYLVQINNCTITSGTFPATGAAIDAFVTISDGTGSMQLKIDHNTDIPGMLTPAGSFTVVGILQQDDFLRPFDSNYDVAPRNRVDVGGTPSTGPGLLSIADARVDVDVNGFTPGDYVPDRLNQTVHIHGVVTSINFRGSNGSGIEYYIQDATAGVDIFSTATTRAFSIGDNLDVIGTVKQYNGLTEIDPGATLANLTVLTPGTLPSVSPTLVTCSQLGDSGAGEPFEGRLLRLNNVTLSAPPATFAASTNYTISDSTGPCTIRISASTNLVGQAAPAGTFSIAGVLGEFDSTAPFDSGYQLFPRSTGDLLPSVPAAASIAVNTGSPQSATVGTAFAIPLSALVKDSGNAPISGAGVTFTAPATGASGTFSNASTSVSVITDGSGIATAPAFTANATIGAYNVVASTPTSLTANFALTNLSSAATHFSVTAPATATAGTAFNVTVTALNASNAAVTSYGGTVHFTSTSAGTLPADYTFVAGDNGTHTFSATLTTSGSQSVTATDSINSLTGSANTTVSAPPATHFSVTAPANVTSGTPFSVTVTALDASNATVTGYTGTVHFTSSSAGTLPADYTFVAGDNGSHTFSVTLTTAGAQTITATDSVNSLSGSGSTSVGPPPATHFGVSAPATATTGTPFNVTVTALDASNATATSYRGTVHFTTSASGASLPANYTFTAADNGVHTFPATLTTTGTSTLTATDTVDATITGSASVSIGCPPLAVTAANNGPVCAGAPVQLTATTAATGVTFQWSGPNGFTSAQQNPGGITTAGPYTVTMSDTAGCIATSSTTVVVNPLPVPAISAAATLCAHGSRNTASVVAISGGTYAWSISGGNIIGASNLSSILFNAGGSGNVVLTVTVHSAAGCAAIATKSITIRPRPTATIPAQAAICGAGNVTIPVTLTGTAPFALVWSDGVTQSGITATTTSRTFAASVSTTLSIASVTDASCSGSVSNSIAISVDTAASITKQPQDANVKPGDSATLTVKAGGTNLHYAWFAGAVGDTSAPVGSDASSYTTRPITAKQTFWVRVSNGCGSVDSQAATVTPVPPRPHTAHH